MTLNDDAPVRVVSPTDARCKDMAALFQRVGRFTAV